MRSERFPVDYLARIAPGPIDINKGVHHSEGDDSFACSQKRLFIRFEELSPDIRDDAFVVPICENSVVLSRSPCGSLAASLAIRAVSCINQIKRWQMCRDG